MSVGPPELSASSPRPALQDGRTAAVVAAAAVILLGYGAWIATRPFGEGALLTSLTVYSELFAASWEEFGFVRAKGVPMISPIGDTVAEREPYLHQAPIGWWHPYLGRTLFGKRELGYKFFAALLTAGGAFVLVLVVRRFAGAISSLVWLVGFLACPVVLLYGALPGIESISLFFASIFVVLWWWARERPSRLRWAATALWFLLGCQMAWSFYFMAPGVLLSELLRPRGDRRLREALLLFPLGVLGFCLVAAHLIAGTGSVGLVFEKMLATGTQVFTEGVTEARVVGGVRVTFLTAQPAFWLLHLGPVGAPLMAVSLAVAIVRCRWRHDPLTLIGSIFLIQGVLTVVLFNTRSNSHGYYWFLMSAPYALFLVQGVRMLREALAHGMGKRAALASALALLASLIVVGVVNVRPLKAQSEREGLASVAAAIDAHVGPNDWICALESNLHGAMLYSKRRWTPPLGLPDHVDGILEARARGDLQFNKLYVLVDPVSERQFPELFERLQVLARRPGSVRILVGETTVFIL